MRPAVKRLVKDLEALGFSRKPHPTRHGSWIYTHANAPSEELKVHTLGTHMAENAIRLVQRRAHKIAGLGTTGPRDAETLREVANIKRQKAKAARDRENRERNERGAKAEAEYQARQQAAASDKQRQDTEGLMQPGYGK